MPYYRFLFADAISTAGTCGGDSIMKRSLVSVIGVFLAWELARAWLGNPDPYSAGRRVFAQQASETADKPENTPSIVGTKWAGGSSGTYSFGAEGTLTYSDNLEGWIHQPGTWSQDGDKVSFNQRSTKTIVVGRTREVASTHYSFSGRIVDGQIRGTMTDHTYNNDTFSYTLKPITPWPPVSKHRVPQSEMTFVGAAGGVSGEVWLTYPDGTRRKADSGVSVYKDTRVETGADGKLQVMLLDETVFTIGANSEMYIDEFVYDPANAVNNKFSAKVSKGFFRFVTGKIARKENIKIKFPYFVGGIRGTEFIAEVSDSGATTITMFSGSIELVPVAGGGPVTVRAGERIEFAADGRSYRVTQVDLESIDRKWRDTFGRFASPRGTGEPVSLFDGNSLTGWKVTNVGGEDAVRVEGNQITLEKGDDLTGITTTRDVLRSNYEISLEAMPIDGDDFFCGLTFPLEKSYCTMIVGGWGGSIVGLSNINGAAAADNETTSLKSFTKGRWYRIRLRVTTTKIEAWIDEDQVVDVPIEGREFSVNDDQKDSCPLGISSWQTTTALRNIELRKL